jgi:transposase
MKRLSRSIRRHIISLIWAGDSTRAIASQTGVSHTTVSQIRSSCVLEHSKPHPGRPRSLSSYEEREIARLARTGKVLTAVDAKKEMDELELASVSVDTVRRTLNRSGLRARIRKSKPLLRPHHREKRLEFAMEHEKWTLDDWHKVIWSDETKISIFGPEGRHYCWREPGEPSMPHHFEPTVKHGGGSIFLWACMTANGVGFMAKIDNGLDANLYREILNGELADTVKWYGMNWDQIIFQHDNDPKHTAILTCEWIIQSGLHVIHWPSQSPDLNPMEHLWAELKRRIRSRPNQPSNLKDLWAAIEEEWNGIPADFCLRLINTMPSRIQDVLKAKGGQTSW